MKSLPLNTNTFQVIIHQPLNESILIISYYTSRLYTGGIIKNICTHKLIELIK